MIGIIEGFGRRRALRRKACFGWNMVKQEDERWAECRDFGELGLRERDGTREKKEAGHEGICGWNGEI